MSTSGSPEERKQARAGRRVSWCSSGSFLQGKSREWLQAWITLLMHTQPEKLQPVGPTRTRDLVIVTEGRSNDLDGVSLAHLCKGSAHKSLEGGGAVRILRDASIRGDDRVMGGKGKLDARTKERDRLLLAIEESGRIRREPRFPGNVRKGTLPDIQITHCIHCCGGDFRLGHRVPKNDGAHIAIWPPSSRRPLPVHAPRSAHARARPVFPAYRRPWLRLA